MAVIRDNSQQTTANVMIVQGDGERKTVATASCHIRPGKGMSINVDILDDAATAAENVADVTGTIAAYIGEEVAKAVQLGIPWRCPRQPKGGRTLCQAWIWCAALQGLTRKGTHWCLACA